MHSQLLKGGMLKEAEGFSDVMVRAFSNSDVSAPTGCACMIPIRCVVSESDISMHAYSAPACRMGLFTDSRTRKGGSIACAVLMDIAPVNAL